MAVSEVKRPLHGRFGSETAKNLTAIYILRTSPNGPKCPFGCNGHVTAVAVGQSQPLYSGVRIFTGNYLSFLYRTSKAVKCTKGSKLVL
jgi:hypothetical protein